MGRKDRRQIMVKELAGIIKKLKLNCVKLKKRYGKEIGEKSGKRLRGQTEGRTQERHKERLGNS